MSTTDDILKEMEKMKKSEDNKPPIKDISGDPSYSVASKVGQEKFRRAFGAGKS